MPQDFSVFTHVDLSTGTSPNIKLANNGWILPDQIDGYNYLNPNSAQVEVIVDRRDCSGDCDTVYTLQVLNGSTVMGSFNITQCPDTFYFCADSSRSYTILDSSTGIQYVNAIANNTVQYPPQSGLFDFSDPTICCFAAADTANFKQITSSITIASDEVWAGKYNVHPNVTVTVTNGATLDLTNVDIVFGECAAMAFGGGAHLRANNSVFRPCDELKSWGGMRFKDATGVVHECTFKNADMGILLSGGGQVRVTNNLFVDNYIGIGTQISTLSEGITGNTFLIENTPVFYHNPTVNGCQVLSGNSRFGIVASQKQLNMIISQNDFIFSADKQLGLEFIGIYCRYSSGGTISGNNFTNMYRSVDMDGSSRFTVENNEVEVTYANDGPQYQMRFTISSSIDLVGNTINFSGEIPGYQPLNAGIYVEKSTGILARRSTITGFNSGIMMINTTDSKVLENYISRSDYFGVYVEGGKGIDIACNEVKMNLNPNLTCIGIGYLQMGSLNQEAITIRSNCVSETQYAILLYSAASGAPIPDIRNNFLYNYRKYGVFNFNFAGGIGTGPSFAASGRNTFVSNNIPGFAVDIASILPMTAAGNYGISSVTNVTVLANNLYNSTATCGRQIGTISSENSDYEVCKDANGIFRIAQLVPGGQEYALDVDFEEKLKSLGQPSRYLQLLSALRLLSGGGSVGEIAKLDRAVEENAWLSDGDMKLYRYFSRYHAGDFAAARTLLEAVEDPGFRAMEGIRLDLQAAGKAPTALDDEQVAILEAVAAAGGPFAGDAREYIHSARGDHDYLFKVPFQPDLPDLKGILITDDHLTVYPNPARDALTIEFALVDAEGATLQVVDLTGRVLFSREIDSNHGREILELDRYVPGVYLVSLVREGQMLARGKFLKL